MNYNTIVEILTAETSNLEKLATIAEVDPYELYSGVDWSDLDLSSEQVKELRGFGGLVDAPDKRGRSSSRKMSTRQAAFVAQIRAHSATAIEKMEAFVFRHLNDNRLAAIKRILIHPLRIQNQLQLPGFVTENFLTNGLEFLISVDDIFLREKSETLLAFLALCRSLRLPPNSKTWTLLKEQDDFILNEKTVFLAFDVKICPDSFLIPWLAFIVTKAKEDNRSPESGRHPAIEFFRYVCENRKPYDADLLLELVGTLKSSELVLHALAFMRNSLTNDQARAAARLLATSANDLNILDKVYRSNELSIVIKVAFGATILESGDDEAINLVLSDNLKRSSGASGLELFAVFSHLGAKKSFSSVTDKISNLNNSDQLLVLSALEKVAQYEGNEERYWRKIAKNVSQGIRRENGKWVQL